MAVNFNSTSSVNNFFNASLGVGNYSNNSSGINDLLTSGSLTEYSTIKSGTYKKLLSAYYTKNDSTETEDKTELMKNKTISTQASNATDFLNDIKKMDITEENKESVQDKIKQFVDSYNSVVDELTESDTKSVLQKGVWMTKAVSSYASVLSKVGVVVGSDNKLSFNSETFEKVSTTQIESVFKGNMSVGSKIMYKINQLENIASNNGISSYTNTGKKSTYSMLSTFDEYL